jgi:hypothetical protein
LILGQIGSDHLRGYSGNKGYGDNGFSGIVKGEGRDFTKGVRGLFRQKGARKYCGKRILPSYSGKWWGRKIKKYSGIFFRLGYTSNRRLPNTGRMSITAFLLDGSPKKYCGKKYFPRIP